VRLKTVIARLSATVVVVTLCLDAPAQTLSYTTTWLGNTFGGGPKWVQNFIEGMYVAPDGTVYAASGWDEAGREFGLYRNGDVIGKCSDTHGWGTNGGPAVVASEKYVFIAHSHGNEGGHLTGEKYPPKGFEWFGISRRTMDGKPAPFPGGRGRFGDMLILHEAPTKVDAHVRGLAVDSKGRLYAGDPNDGLVRVFDAETMKPITSWKVARARQIALDAKDTLWVIQSADAGEPAKILRFSAEGKPLPQQIAFKSPVSPTALCVDRKTGRLLVSDNGPAQQVLIFEGIDAVPKLVGTFGEPGGIYGGKTPGLAGPLRFSGPTGVGADAEGNVYVGCNQPAGGSILRAFSPTGELKWELLGLEFVDAADPVPGSDGTDVFTTECRYTLDWGKDGAGKQWTWRSQTIDPFRYPNDPRLHEGHHNMCAALYREIGGKPFLVVRGMFQHAMVFYKLQGEIAVPSAMFAKGPYRSGNWANVPQPEKGRWIWRDLNGDGDFQADEFLEADGVREPESWAWWVDEKGDVWQGDQTGKEPIRHYLLQWLDEKGNPVYSRAKSETLPLPAPMNHLLRIEYHPAADTMYLTGHTTDRPKTGGEWGQVGSEAWRIDNWSKGNRAPRWRIALPYQPETKVKTPGASVPNVTIKSFCTAGDAVFAVESRTAKVHVYDAGTGTKLGEMTPGPEVAKESGWVDFPDAIRACRRKNGEYLVFVEEDAKAKIIIYRWTPGARPLSLPTIPQHAISLSRRDIVRIAQRFIAGD